MNQFVRAARLAPLMALLVCPPVWPQVPPHPPGSVCYTPQFWCWAPFPGPVGAGCSCPTNAGWVAGRLG